jgi:phosphate transport system permease protein
MTEQSGAFTGRARKRTTRPGVLLMDKVSRFVITVGGIGTIVAVLFILFFLIAVVVPLFQGADVAPEATAFAAAKGEILRLHTDEFRVATWELLEDGRVVVRRLDTGEVIERHEAFPRDSLTSISAPTRGNGMAFGLKDGRIILGSIDFETTFFEPEDPAVPDHLRDIPEGEPAVWDGGMVERTPAGQLRRQKLAIQLDEPVQLEPASPVIGVDRTEKRGGPAFCALTADGKLHFREIRVRRNIMTGKVKRRVRGTDIDVDFPEGKGLPEHLILSGLADNIFMIWPDGHLLRQSIRNIEEPELAEVRDLIPEKDGRMVAFVPVIGKGTLAVADNLGRVRAWFLATSPARETVDGMALVLGHELEIDGGRITTLSASTRNRIIGVGTDQGRVQLFFVTSRKLLADLTVDGGQPVEHLSMAPRENGLVAVAGDKRSRWSIDVGHPEATFRTLFLNVLYEGYTEPQFRWQTSGATDEVEMKLSLMPLIFGTLKATLYSMLFAVPLALLAAIYTSEFLHPRIRPRIKSIVEIMASLPSVVLGFLAAFVMAPFVEDVVPAVLMCFLMIPLSLLIGAALWQLLPRPTTLGLERFRLGFLTACLPVGVVLAFALGGVAEEIFFYGDIKAWLDGQEGSGGAAGGWALLFLPLGAIAGSILFGKLFGRNTRGLSEGGAARYALVKFVATGAIAVILAALVAFLLEGLGFDPRGGLFNTYVQRNALVVGFAMGFAVIPIIYTIAEDALSAVPEHLRAASLGAGATPWQTATRVIVPTAASGLFSACMIGLGRAVGETMIVLMAAGNTPIMEWNPFEGFQTLSAAIATEMPEAVKDSTHYRVLFLAGLSLFAMTFVVNTIAEAVRLRFRRRAFQL